ncbi:MAG: Na-K-Cl cotransporter [Simkaniaceae bacterium]
MSTSDQIYTSASEELPKQKQALKFNAFTGVFLPTSLSIFGVILYLRLGWIIGAGGLLYTIMIISLASCVTLLTSFSISATVTNMKIGAGGVYYMLSRTFGLEVGSAISLPLYLAQAIGISFYISGFTESLSYFLPNISLVFLSLTTLGMVAILAFFSTSFALKSQFFILLLLVLSLVSIFFSHPIESPATDPGSIKNFPFWALFPIFFPAVTGIESGLGMSGELKNPRRAIPAGTIAAVITGMAVYIALSIFLAGLAPRQTLLTNTSILQEVAWIRELVLLGIWGATLSSSISCMLSAPRTLQALSMDGIIPRFLGKNLGHPQNPRMAILFTAMIAAVALIFGDINSIAPILTMFFLISYATLNLAASLEGFFENPSWRPTFHVHPLVSLFGFLLCLFCMLMMSVASTIIAWMLVASIYLLMKKRVGKSNFDDIRHSILLFLSRFAIYRLANTPKGPKSWRPNLLAFVGDPILRRHLIQFTQNVTHGKGFLAIASIYPEKTYSKEIDFSSYQEKMREFFANMELPALIEIKNAPTVIDGMKTLIHDYGIGSLIPNTVVLGATRKKDQFRVYAEVIMMAHQLRKNVIIIRESHQSQKTKKRRKQIDAWWGGQNRRNSDLILVLAYMLQTSKEWKGSKLNLKTVISNEKYKDVMLKNLREFSHLSRIRVFPQVVKPEKEEKIFEDTILRCSSRADLVFLGLRPPKPDESVEDYAAYYEQLLKITQDYPPIAFVLSGEAFEFGQILR